MKRNRCLVWRVVRVFSDTDLFDITVDRIYGDDGRLTNSVIETFNEAYPGLNEILDNTTTYHYSYDENGKIVAIKYRARSVRSNAADNRTKRPTDKILSKSRSTSILGY